MTQNEMMQYIMENLQYADEETVEYIYQIMVENEK